MSVRTAQTYMRVAQLADSKSATVALLPPKTLRRLAAKSLHPRDRLAKGDLHHLLRRVRLVVEARKGEAVQLLHEQALG